MSHHEALLDVVGRGWTALEVSLEVGELVVELLRDAPQELEEGFPVNPDHPFRLFIYSIPSMRESVSTKSVLKQIKSLEEFRVAPEQTVPLYHPPLEVPPFLQSNLLSPQRAIREFTGESALVKAFYFSLMRLALELENEEEDYGDMVRRKLVEEEEFEVGQFEDANFTDRQYRTFIKQFMVQVEKGDPPSFETTIQRFPVIDQMLFTIFKKMVPVPLLMPEGGEDEKVRRILKYLCQKFNMTLEQVGGCFKMEEPDIFVYLQDSQTVFLVYQNPDPQSDTPSSSCSDLSLSQISHALPGARRSTIVSRRSTISSGQNNFSRVVSILGSNSKVSKGSEMREPVGEFKKAPKDSILNTKGSRFSKRQANSDYYPGQKVVTVQDKKQKENQHLRRISEQKSEFEAGQSTITDPLAHSRSNPSLRMSGIKLESKKSQSPSPFAKERYSSAISANVKQPSNVDKEHLSLFSKIASNVRQLDSPVKEPPAQVDDSGYDKFTDSGLLQILDEKYKQEIRGIKKRYRENRHNIRQFI